MSADRHQALLESGGHTVFRARDGLEAYRLFYENEFDLVMVGPHVEKVDSTELVKLLRSVSPVAILVQAPMGHTRFVLSMLEAGADGVLVSTASDEELLAVRPKLGEAATSGSVRDQPSVAAQRPIRGGTAARHPLDGTPLKLRTEGELVDPLAPEAAPKPAPRAR